MGGHGHDAGYERQHSHHYSHARRPRRSHVLPGDQSGYRRVGHDARERSRQSAGDHPVGWRRGAGPGRCCARRQSACWSGGRCPPPRRRRRRPRGGAGGGPRQGGNNPPFPNGTTSWQQAAISLGWGYGNHNPGSIQADSGANNQLRQGIIGLINKGQPRKVDDWGALRAWAWGAGKLIDFFEKDSLVDAKQVAFEGHSRYGKATLVTLVYEPRVLTGFVSSSGEGGAKLWRHLVGEQVRALRPPVSITG